MKKKYISFILFLLFLAVIPCSKVNAKNKTETRLSIDSTELYINKQTTVNVTYANRKAGEELTVKSSNSSILKAKLGKWDGNTESLILLPQKEGKATLNITGPKKENIQIIVHVLERKQLSGSQLYKRCSEAVVEVITLDSVQSENIGSGFFINGNMIVTNYHVIDCASDIIIRDCYGDRYEVQTIYAYNKDFDLAVLGIKGKALNALICDFSEVETGMEVYAIGSPTLLTGSISDGIVSKAYRDRDGVICHQNTASISQCSGGGPLLNTCGEVIGINTSRLLDGQNINFAVDVNYLTQFDYTKKKSAEEFYKENAGKVKNSNVYITLP